MQYNLFKYGTTNGAFGSFYSQADAIDVARKALQRHPESVFVVKNDDDYLVASISNRRIVGVFNKQEWGGHRGNDALFIGQERFDATDAILLLAPNELRSIVDSSESSDSIGRLHVDWSGPCYVSIEDAICEFFGVDDVEDVTDEALLFARNERSPVPSVFKTVTLSIKVEVRVCGDASMQDFIDNLDYSITSNTAGITTIDTEVIGAE